jgi:hypothetical protein
VQKQCEDKDESMTFLNMFLSCYLLHARTLTAQKIQVAEPLFISSMCDMLAAAPAPSAITESQSSATSAQ